MVMKNYLFLEKRENWWGKEDMFTQEASEDGKSFDHRSYNGWEIEEIK